MIGAYGVPKLGWHRGPWNDEPDREEWRALSLPCLAVRSTFAGSWCGYVGVPPGHPWHGVDFDRIDTGISVHGGLTYSAACEGPICHVPQPGEADAVWWLGFDTAHSGDRCPAMDALTGRQRDWETYRDLAYVREQVERLAVQITQAAGGAA